MIFPLISALVSVLVMFVFIFFTNHIIGKGVPSLEILLDMDSFERSVPLLILFSYYLINNLVMMYFNGSIIVCANQLLQGKEIDIKEGFKVAKKKIGKILILYVSIGIIEGNVHSNIGRLRDGR